MKKNEVLTPEVMEEIPLEKQIDRTLVKHNVTNAVIARLKKEFGSLKLNDVNDKEKFRYLFFYYRIGSVVSTFHLTCDFDSVRFERRCFLSSV